MKLPSAFPRLKGFRFARDVIAYAVWTYHRFALSAADVEDLLAERGVIVSRETVCLWVNRFGRHFAGCLRKDRPKPNDKWHMDEAVITMSGRKFWLWRAIDADGDVLDILVQTRRNTKAATRFFSRLVRHFGRPRVIVTDKLGSYVKQIHNLAPDADHRVHKGLNNRIENSHRQTRKREKIMGRFKLPQAQRFLSAHDQINTIFRPRRYNLSAASYRNARADAFCLWAEYTAEMVA
ncbi:IS6 family transposase [Rhizobium rhizogenes]|uniref:IS6 family transposase n=1 Tax=Rhizobium rhizogenes TaxID=359 RepID=UPI0022BD5EE8|nr:IS6 family transposase [Rhizobium rhizogenes]MCZ7481291.1 IS6 family transposase [Rhizobium rhizogenes]